MKPLYSQEEFDSSKTPDRLPLECYNCGEKFMYRKKDILETLNPKLHKQGKFCSQKCKYRYEGNTIMVKCGNCDKEIEKNICEVRKSKSGEVFCSQSCGATYNNKNKEYGTRRSKLETWLEEKLINLCPNLKIHFNRKDTIGSELDIYIPSLNLAFELNGIFHYEPIFGEGKLSKIQENDISKSKACIDNRINLCIIDSSQQKKFTPESSQQYLDIITNIINTH